jgi:dCMP deaminase
VRPDHDTYFLRMAQLVSTRSTCLRRAVGCVLVNGHHHVLATGYNGVARGQPHCNEPTGFDFVYANGVDAMKPLTGQSTGKKDVFAHACAGATAVSGDDLHRCEAIHAEQNALLQCRDPQAILTAYVTTTPCIHCAKLLLNTSCPTIVAPSGEVYDPAALALWERAGRAVRFVALAKPL